MNSMSWPSGGHTKSTHRQSPLSWGLGYAGLPAATHPAILTHRVAGVNMSVDSRDLHGPLLQSVSLSLAVAG
jgi:hypothetical protein